MDQQIKLRNKATEQECAFDDQAQADNFLKHVEHKKDWAEVKPATDADAAEQPAAA